MSALSGDSRRDETDASLRVERENTDNALAKRAAVEEEDADRVLALARERADRLLAAARAAADARLPLSEQTQAMVSLLRSDRAAEDRDVAAERRAADEILVRERAEQREKVSALLVLERETTDLYLALERRASHDAVTSRDDFLAVVSHDLAGVLAAQKLVLGLLAKEVDAMPGSRVAAHLATLTRIEAQADRLVGDLVDVLAIEEGELSISRKPHSAADLVATAVSVFEPLARERGHSLAVVQGQPDVAVMVDLTRGLQILGNLLSNAIKFTPPEGKIRVGFEASAGEVVFSVSDSGPGIPADKAAHLFDRFFRGTSGAPGLGLGLYITRHLVQAHGGRLWFDANPAGGTVFRFTLARGS